MKKKLDFIVYILYNYYNKGPTASIAYESALMGLTLSLYLNTVTLIVLFGVDLSIIEPYMQNYGKGVRFLTGFLLMLPFYILLKITFNEGEIEKKKYTTQKIKIGNTFVLLYVILSVIIFIISIKF